MTRLMSVDEIALREQKLDKESDDAASLVREAKPVDWVVEPMIVAGGITIFSGEPKLGNKSMMALYACMCVAQGNRFLGMATRRGAATFANLEDGRQRCANRLRNLNYQPREGDERFRIVTSRSALDTLLDYTETGRSSLVVLDPTIELEVLLGVKNENAAIDIARFLSEIREKVRDTQTACIMSHHTTKDKVHVRGSSAFEGAVDAWVTITPELNGILLLEWTTRDRGSWWMRVSAQWSGEFVTYSPLGEPNFGFLERPKKGGKKGDDGSGAPEDPTSVIYDRAVTLLSDGAELGLNELSGQFAENGWDVSKRKLLAAMDALMKDGLVEKGKKGRSKPYLLTERGREYLQEMQPPEPTDLDALLDVTPDESSETYETPLSETVEVVEDDPPDDDI